MVWVGGSGRHTCERINTITFLWDTTPRKPTLASWLNIISLSEKRPRASAGIGAVKHQPAHAPPQKRCMGCLDA